MIVYTGAQCGFVNTKINWILFSQAQEYALKPF